MTYPGHRLQTDSLNNILGPKSWNLNVTFICNFSIFILNERIINVQIILTDFIQVYTESSVLSHIQFWQTKTRIFMLKKVLGRVNSFVIFVCHVGLWHIVHRCKYLLTNFLWQQQFCSLIMFCVCPWRCHPSAVDTMISVQ